LENAQVNVEVNIFVVVEAFILKITYQEPWSVIRNYTSMTGKIMS